MKIWQAMLVFLSIVAGVAFVIYIHAMHKHQMEFNAAHANVVRWSAENDCEYGFPTIPELRAGERAEFYVSYDAEGNCQANTRVLYYDPNAKCGLDGYCSAP